MYGISKIPYINLVCVKTLLTTVRVFSVLKYYSITTSWLHNQLHMKIYCKKGLGGVNIQAIICMILRGKHLSQPHSSIPHKWGKLKHIKL